MRAALRVEEAVEPAAGAELDDAQPVEAAEARADELFLRAPARRAGLGLRRGEVERLVLPLPLPVGRVLRLRHERDCYVRPRTPESSRR